MAGAPAPAPAAQVSLTPGARAALLGGFVVVVALLVLTAVTLISQRQRTVLLNRQLGTLVGEATLALHGLSPVLAAEPGNSATIRKRADAAASLVSATRPLISKLGASQLPSTLTAAGDVIDTADRLQIVPRLANLLAVVPAGAALIDRLSDLLAAVQREGLVPGAAAGLRNLRSLVLLQTHTLAVQEASLREQRRTRSISQQTLMATRQAVAAVRQSVALARETLAVAQQTLAHAASLDRKVTGPVP